MVVDGWWLEGLVLQGFWRVQKGFKSLGAKIHDFRPNLSKSALKSEHAIENISPPNFA